MKKTFIALLLGFMMLSVSLASAHSGATNARGCHHDHKHGGHHCHR